MRYTRTRRSDTTKRGRKTAAQRRVELAIRAWHHKHDDQRRSVRGIAHIYPRAYVVAKIAPRCLVVAMPECDAEPQVRGQFWTGCNWVRRFDDSLKAGDWCSVAYLCLDGCQEEIAIPVVP